MGAFIFLVWVMVEGLLAIFSIMTKSNQQRKRSIIRITELAIFLAFTITSTIEWSIRYYPLFGLLLLLATIGLIDLIRNRDDKSPYKTSRVIYRTIGLTVLMLILILPSIVYPQHKIIHPTGEYQVSTTDYSYTDTKRMETYTNTGENRKLNVRIWYPKTSKGKFPLIVFSPGAFGTKTSNTSLCNELASHGYVVCAIDHTYQCVFTTDVDGNTMFMNSNYRKEISMESDYRDKRKNYVLYRKWMEIRMGDISFVVDNIISEEKNLEADQAYSLVDPSNVGVMGYSLGGSAALGLGRARDDINAVIALESSFLYDIKGVKDGEFIFTDEVYPTSLLNIYSDYGWSLLPMDPQYVENYELLNATNPKVFNIHISGVGHFNFTDLALESPILARIYNGKKSTTDNISCLKTINKVCLNFFNSYLKAELKFEPNETY